MNSMLLAIICIELRLTPLIGFPLEMIDNSWETAILAPLCRCFSQISERRLKHVTLIQPVFFFYLPEMRG